MKKQYYEPPMFEVVNLNSDTLVIMTSSYTGSSTDLDVEDKDVTWL